LLSKSLQMGSEMTGAPRVITYKRYEIETHHAPPRRKQPHPFTPRVSKFGLAGMLLREASGYNLKLRRKEYRQALLSRPCIYGVFSGRFGGFHPIKEKCTGCMRCVQEFPGFCTVDRNPEFYAFADSYWVPDMPMTASGSPVATVSFEAETGKIPVRGMGYRGAFAGEGWDSMWTDMSEIVRPTRDGVYGREFISTLVDIGMDQLNLEPLKHGPREPSRNVEVSLPIIFDYLPPNLNAPSIIRAIAGAAQRTETMFIANPEQTQHLEIQQPANFVPLVSAETIREDVIRGARVIELTEFDSSLIDDVRQMNPNASVSVRLPLSRESDKAATEMVRAGVDVIHLHADYHGRGWDKDESIFVKDLVRSVHGRLVKEAIRDAVTLIVSGGITLAEHVPKAIICGADLVAIDTTVLVALQARFLGECKSAETGRIAPDEFGSSWGEQRLVNLLGAWHDQLIEILSAMGMRDVRRLRGDVGRAMFNEDLEKEAFSDVKRRT
jgi:hypothetical protein